MSDKKDIDNSIESAYRGHKAALSSSRTKPAKKNSIYRLPALLILLAACLAYWQLVVIPQQQALQQAMHASAVDIIMEADASVYLYFRELGELPDQLPHLLLEDIVWYQQIDENTYSLDAQLPNVTGAVTVKTDEVLEVSLIEAVLE